MTAILYLCGHSLMEVKEAGIIASFFFIDGVSKFITVKVKTSSN